MDSWYKIYYFVVFVVIITTFIMIVQMIITHIAPSTTVAGWMAFTWVSMIMTNPAWKEIWKKKK
jgi:hypothetical protein